MDIFYIGHSCYLIKTAQITALIDPWLTDRLDRFWVHHPQQFADFDIQEIDAVFITHHHIDHFHIESLSTLRPDTMIFVPSPEKTPNFAGSGMGFKAIPWSLRHLGFQKIHYLEPFSKSDVGGISVTCLPSKVGFPEFTYLISNTDGTVAFCGDSILHPKTEEYLSACRPNIDIAFIPCHSTSPAEPLMQRKKVNEVERFKNHSIETFQRNIDHYKARCVVPSAFGFKVDGVDRDDRFEWANRSIFPFTPDEAVFYMHQTNQNCHKFNPGDSIRLINGNINIDSDASNYKVYKDMEICGDTEVPAFVPGEQGEIDADRNLDALMARAGEELIGTRYWLRGIEIGRTAHVKLSNSADDSAVYLFNPGSRHPWQRLSDSTLDYTLPYTWLHSNTLERLLESDLLMSSSYGLWVSTDNWLTHVFHHPKHHVRHLSKNLV